MTPKNPQKWKEYSGGLLVEKRKEFEVQDRTLQKAVTVGFAVRVKLEAKRVKRVCVASKNGKTMGPGNFPGVQLKHGTKNYTI